MPYDSLEAFENLLREMGEACFETAQSLSQKYQNVSVID